MGKMKAMTVLLFVVLVYQAFSATAQAPEDKTAKIKDRFETKLTGEPQASGFVDIVLVNPYSDWPQSFSKKEFKQELQHRLALQIRFSLAIQLLAWLIGLLTLVVTLRFRRRMSELDHRKCVP
ncbi:MAG: hypothetical protein H6Q07_1856 [Acidobacteria bacterium]|nr:hypothetical protein [Acidobacteriota bacterium]MBP1623836.1 hypothetical protein [Acidobacteriota bacterium]